MARKIQVKRGLKQDLPQLDVAEFGFTTDTKELFIGSNDGNVQLSNEEDLNNIQRILDEHIEDNVNNPDGVHGIRVTLEGVLEYYLEGNWHEISGGGSVAVGDVSNLTSISSNDGKHINLTWKNPTNEEFVKVVVFASDEDISNKKYQDLMTNGNKIVDGNAEEFSYSTSHGKISYFKAFAVHEIFGNESVSRGENTSALAQDTLPPDTITNIITLEFENRVKISWTNPTDEDFDKVRILYNSSSTPQDTNDGIVAYEGKGTSTTVTGLVNEIEYFFRAFTYDDSGNINNDSSMEFSAIPQAWENVDNLVATTAQDGESINITWDNPSNEEGYEGIELYVSETDLSLKSREQCATDGTLIGTGNIVSKTHNTVKNTTYYFKIFVKYVVGEETKYSSGVYTSEKAVDTKPPAQITNFTVVKEDNQMVQLSWTNPTDNDFDKTKIVYKSGSYPSSQTDGNVGYEGSAISANITGLTNDTEYFFRAFTYDTSNNIQTSTTGAQIKATPSDVKIYGVRIDTTNSNPETAVTYTDSAVGMAGGNNSWDNVYPFNQIRPVLYKGGNVVGELNKNDFSKFTNGSNADIASGDAGDVMIEFPRVWWKFERIGTDLHVKYAAKQVDSTWKAWGHTKDNTVKDFVYIGAYLGFNLSGKLRSLSGKAPTGGQTIGTFRTQAQANGDEYQQMGYYQLLMLQVLYLVRYKSLDSQAALGRGYVDGNSSYTNTGGTDVKGMYFGETSGKQQMKFSGIEDFYGNKYYWIDGLYSDNSRNILIGTENFNDTGNDYENYGQGTSSNISGYFKDVQGGTETGFIIKETDGSATTYYSDNGILYAGSLPYFGGYRDAASAAGAFLLRVAYSAATSDVFIGGRLFAL